MPNDRERDFVWNESPESAEIGAGSSDATLPMDPSSGVPPADTPEPPMMPFPAISGFWRRFGAFMLDGLLLAVVGQLLGWTLAPFWFQVGPYGRFVGLFIALSYFGIMDSWIAGGRTLGKRVAAIAVRSEKDEPIGLGRSLLRTAIWLIPLTLNGWALPILANSIAAWITTVVLVGIGGAVVFTMVFNRRSRQGLQDMVCKTYVVRLKGRRIAGFPVTTKAQWVASAVLVGVAVILASATPFITGALSHSTPIGALQPLYQTLQADNRFFSANVVDQTFYSTGEKNQRALVISVWYKGRPQDSDLAPLTDDVASVALQRVPNVDQYDLIRVDIASQFDLGVSSGHLSVGDGETPATWRQQIAKAKSK